MYRFDFTGQKIDLKAFRYFYSNFPKSTISIYFNTYKVKLSEEYGFRIFRLVKGKNQEILNMVSLNSEDDSILYNNDVIGPRLYYDSIGLDHDTLDELDVICLVLQTLFKIDKLLHLI